MTVAEKRWNTTTRPNIDAWCSVLQDPEEYEKHFEKNRNPRGHWPIEGVRAFKDICLAVSYEALGGRRCFCSWQQGLAGSREVIPPHQHPTQARGKGQRTLARVSTTEPGPSDSFSEMPPALFSRLLAENLPRSAGKFVPVTFLVQSSPFKISLCSHLQFLQWSGQNLRHFTHKLCKIWVFVSYPDSS